VYKAPSHSPPSLAPVFRGQATAMCEYAAACDARAIHVGTYSSWLTKQKSDGARAKWFSNAAKRYFTLDYDSQIFFYSHSEDRNKISQPVRFQDMLVAEQLPARTTQAKPGEHVHGFVLRTSDRAYELYTGTYLDAQHWVEALNAARDIARGAQPSGSTASPGDAQGLGPTPALMGGGTNAAPFVAACSSGRELSRSSLSTTVDGDSDVGGSSESGHSTERRKGQPRPLLGGQGVSGLPVPHAEPWRPPAVEQPAMQRLPPQQRTGGYASTQPQPALAPAPVVIAAPLPVNDDPFAALDALEEMAGPVPVASSYVAPQRMAPNQSELLRQARAKVTGCAYTPLVESASEGVSHQPWVPSAPATPALAAAPLPAPVPAPAPYVPAAFAAPAPAPAPPMPAVYQPAAAPAPPPFYSAQQHAAAPAPPVPLARAADISWDDDDRHTAAAPRTSAGAARQAFQPMSPGWDDSDDEGARGVAHGGAVAPAPLPPPRTESASCGAPKQAEKAFVKAKTQPKVAAGELDDLDDLVGDMLAADTSTNVIGYGLVDNFHCTGCDFQVMRCDDYVWAGDVEYMFFRNNYPTYEKLRRRLIRQKGCYAYCCQCSWQSADAKAPLTDVAAGLRWREVHF